jgi:hypothetical protein
MSKFRFRVVAIVVILIIPTIGFCYGDKQRRRAEQRPTPDRQAAKAPTKEDLERRKERMAIARSKSPDRWLAGSRPANQGQACTSVVSQLYAYGVTIGSSEVVHCTYDWQCVANGQNACQIVEVCILTYVPTGATIVDHTDVALQCGSSKYPVNYWTFDPQPGEYQVTVDLYPGTWATWTPDTPLLDSAEFSFDWPN